MNPTSNSESFHPSSITNYVNSQSPQSILQATLPLPQAIHDNSASSTQTKYQLSQQTSVTSAQSSSENPVHPTSAQTSYENPILPVHPTDFFYRPPNDF